MPFIYLSEVNRATLRILQVGCMDCRCQFLLSAYMLYPDEPATRRATLQMLSKFRQSHALLMILHLTYIRRYAASYYLLYPCILLRRSRVCNTIVTTYICLPLRADW